MCVINRNKKLMITLNIVLKATSPIPNIKGDILNQMSNRLKLDRQLLRMVIYDKYGTLHTAAIMQKWY